jgi:hypothetical protein
VQNADASGKHIISIFSDGEEVKEEINKELF